MENDIIEVLPPHHGERPSQLFVDQLPLHRHKHFTCMCGRQHFVPEDLTAVLSPEQLQALKNIQDRAPDAVFTYPAGTELLASVLNNEYFVHQCPCNQLGRYEAYLWDVMDVASAYYRARVKYMQEAAQKAAEAVGGNLGAGLPRRRPGPRKL